MSIPTIAISSFAMRSGREAFGSSSYPCRRHFQPRQLHGPSQTARRSRSPEPARGSPSSIAFALTA